MQNVLRGRAGAGLGLNILGACGHRYELEEDPGVCAAMERMAQLFLQDGFQADESAEGTGAGGFVAEETSTVAD